MPRGQRRSTAAELEYENLIVPIGSRSFPAQQGRPPEPLPEGVTVRSGRGVQIRFQFEGRRCFETLPGRPTVKLVRAAVSRRDDVLTLIDLGRFKYEEEFPESKHVREKSRREQLKKVPTTGAALDAWLMGARSSIGPNTRDDYRRTVEFTLKPMPVENFGIVPPHSHAGLALVMLPVDELTTARLSQFRSYLFEERGLSAKRVGNILIPLRQMMPDLVADGHVQRDPFANMKPLKETRVEVAEPVRVTPDTADVVSLEEVAQFKTGRGDADPFAPSEANAILERAYGPVLNMVTFWLDQGLRPGEVLGLQWQDFDLAAGTVTIRRSISKGNVKEDKTNRRRTIKLYPAALAAIEAQVKFSGAQRAWVFPNPATGQRFANESKFNRRWSRLVKAASVRYRPPKQLRHTTASSMVSAGVPIIEAGRFLGHKDMTMIAMHYGQFIAEVGRLAGATYEEKFAPIWAKRIEMLRLQQEVPEEGDWLGLYVEDKSA